MFIREYKATDKAQCLEVFNSNCPHFFDVAERDLFAKWLDHQVNMDSVYQSPTYSDSEKDAYYVIEIPEAGVVGCGGFYVVREKKEARLAWGMIHADFHRKGFGKALFQHRKNEIEKGWPNNTITLGTSQHTYRFYEKMGLTVTNMEKSGYGADLDKYDMIQSTSSKK